MKNRFFDLPLRFQIIIPFSLLIIVLASVSVGFGLPLAEEAASQNVDLKLDSAPSLFRRRLDNETADLERLAGLTAQTPGVSEALAAGDGQRLSLALEAAQATSLDALQVTDAAGMPLWSAGGHSPLSTDTLGSLTGAGPGVAPSSAGEMLVAVQPIGPPDRPAGYVAAGRLLARLLPSLRPSPGAEVAIYRDGGLVATTFPTNHSSGAEVAGPPAGLSLSGGPVKKGTVVGDHAYAAIYDRLPLGSGNGTAFAVFVPKSPAWPAETVVAAALAATVAIALVLLILGFAIARAIAARLERVVEAIEQIGGGDFQQRVDLASSDEVGRLAQVVNRMAGRLQEAETSKAEFLAMASHELKTPLALMHNATELLLDQAPANGNGSRTELLEIIEANIDRMNRRVADLLELARIEAGHLTLHQRPLDLVPLVTEVAEGVGPMLAAREQSLSLELPEVLPEVGADPDRIQQVLLNLVSNAARHTRPGTHIALRARQNGQSVTVEVEDDGPGIPEAKLQRLLDSARRPFAGEGGLGLLIAQRLVALHQGRVWARSEPGRGTVFAFALPLARREE
ncbi:MAG: HAMP domain-containing protein [Chloroflexi bacterium]|nr:HAMP domain-containing protein [Chloroflexota bacterium]